MRGIPFIYVAGLCLGALSPAVAEPPEPCQAEAEQAVESALTGLTPLITVARETPPRTFAEGFRSDGSYTLASGIIVDSGCFADLEGRRARRRRAREFAATSRRMLEVMDRCGSHRLLSSRGFAVYDAMVGRPVFQCERNRCRSRYSCRLSGQNRINLDDPEARTSESTWFHELAHLTEEVDNLSVPEHNRREDASQRDEVYFWERVCFKPGFIVSRMRSGDPLACAALAYQPLDTGGKARYTDREVETVCGFFEDYLHEERGYLKGLALNLYPEIARCGDSDRAAGRCLDPVAANAAIRAAIPSAGGEALPPPKAFASWIKAACGSPLAAEADYSGMETCLETKKISLMTAVRGVEAGAGVSEESVRAHFDGIIQRIRFLADGPGDVTGMPRASQQGDTSVLVEPARRCLAEDGLRGTSFCQVFRERILPRLGRLFVYFGDPR